MDDAGFDACFDIAFRDAAVAMAAKSYQERSVILRHWVDVDAQGQHSIEQGLRWRDMLDAGFDGPRAEARRFDALAYSDRSVLMPSERPILCGRLVEEDGSDGRGLRAQMECRVLESGVAIRSITVDAPVWTYDAAMVAADVAAGHAGPLSLEVRQVGTHATGRAAVLAVAE